MLLLIEKHQNFSSSSLACYAVVVLQIGKLDLILITYKLIWLFIVFKIHFNFS